MELKNVLIGLRMKCAWHSIIKIIFINRWHTETFMPNWVSLAFKVAEISLFKQMERRTNKPPGRTETDLHKVSIFFFEHFQ